MAQDDHAIIVGIDTYPGLSTLGGPCKDARAFHDWLVDADCGAVPPYNIHMLLTTDFHPPAPTGVNDVHPLEEEICRLFRPFITKGINQEIAGRRLYIYLAGHGFGDPSNIDAAALYAADAEPTYAAHIAGTSYAEWLRRNGVFDEIVLIMDCCRTIMQMWEIRPPLLPKSSNPGRVSKIKTVYAYAANWGHASRERKMNGDVRGIFTVAFLNALRNASPNQFGRVTGQMIKDYIHNTIDQVAGDVKVGPPDIHVDSNRDIVFAERVAATSFHARITLAPFTGIEALIIIDGARREVLKQAPAAEVIEADLAPGLYKAFIEKTERSHLFEIGGVNVEFTL